MFYTHRKASGKLVSEKKSTCRQNSGPVIQPGFIFPVGKFQQVLIYFGGRLDGVNNAIVIKAVIFIVKVGKSAAMGNSSPGKSGYDDACAFT